MRNIHNLLRHASPRFVARALVVEAGDTSGLARETICAELYALREHVRLVERDGGLSLDISDALYALETTPGRSPTSP